MRTVVRRLGVALTVIATVAFGMVVTTGPAQAVAAYCSAGVTGTPRDSGTDGMSIHGGTYFARAAYCQIGDTKLHMQSDGNLVIVNLGTGRAIWGAGTNTKGGVRAVFQQDGNLVVLNSSGRSVWSSGTCCALATLILRHARRVEIMRAADAVIIWRKP
jgi:hypothetical protein